ncbi:MAG TPA: 50S ribosomal protein L1 [Candidatus Omnitrophica bacterium]|nr:MAG: 50S ribosomal protein L1 [Omnitrophica WOR_2 bacterium GWA2_45_18]OGX19688.1 MAG: 50S ribosomal protein L1 [Omnitrophica WOR_2 bacterium GWC2_45_7]HBR14626.1 50S ribosomal protein L1 [Candidatus Omnitrophota bacterium]
MVRINKRMKEVKKLFDRQKVYSLDNAVEHMAKFPKVKFDETVELHFMLNVNPKTSDQSVRGTVALPHGLGKKVKVVVFCKGELEQKAKEAGADLVGAQELIEKVEQGFMDFDVVIAAPDMMRDLSKLGKILGPRGLMPTPKAGTVTMDVAKAIKEIKAGKIEFKSDKQGGIHVGIGKRSFSKDKLLENINHLIDAVNRSKPNSVKGNLIRSLSLSSTMGPGLRITL